MEYYSAVKNKITKSIGKSTEMETTILSEARQTQREILGPFAHLFGMLASNLQVHVRKLARGRDAFRGVVKRNNRTGSDK